MVFYAFTLAMRPRNRKYTAQALREIAGQVFNSGGIIRKLSNEGIMRPYNRFRDTDNSVITYARYVTLQIDLGEDNLKKLESMLREHPDVFICMKLNNLEKPIGAKADTSGGAQAFFPLDTFTRMEEEINWPPQVSTDVYEQLDMNWKEFSRTRWSNYLRN